MIRLLHKYIKQLLILSILLYGCKSSILITKTNKDTISAVTGRKFRGSVFHKDYVFYFSKQWADTMFFTPTQKEIELAELLLRAEAKSQKKYKSNYNQERLYISMNLNKYFRQYVGMITPTGEKVIHINFHWDRYSIFERLRGYNDNRLSLEDDYSIVLDGGNRYWEVNVNLNTKKLSNIKVNGIS